MNVAKWRAKRTLVTVKADPCGFKILTKILYGEVRSHIGTNPTPFQYGGALGYHTDTTGHIYTGARVLDPIKTNWITVDPTWPKLSAYSYCYASPITFMDPSGLRPYQGPGGTWPNFGKGIMGFPNTGDYCGSNTDCGGFVGENCIDTACAAHDACLEKVPWIDGSKCHCQLAAAAAKCYQAGVCQFDLPCYTSAYLILVAFDIFCVGTAVIGGSPPGTRSGGGPIFTGGLGVKTSGGYGTNKGCGIAPFGFHFGPNCQVIAD